MDGLPNKEVMCHHTAFQKRCRDMVVECNCRKWVNIQGVHPQTGEAVNRWDCADHWIPVLMIENSKMQRETGAAVESFRNEMVKSQTSIRHVANDSKEIIMPYRAPIALGYD
jgi:hypothetical protein